VAGEIRGFLGIDKPYEPALDPELILETETDPQEVCAQRMTATLELMGYIDCQSDVAVSRRAAVSASSIPQLVSRRS
jgi:adenylylsulfate kinase